MQLASVVDDESVKAVILSGFTMVAGDVDIDGVCTNAGDKEMVALACGNKGCCLFSD